MDAKIDIYGISGDVICSVLITKDAVSHEELMTSDYIQLSWNDDKTIVLPAGAYIIYQDEKYSLIEPYLPLRENEAEYKYTPQFHSRIMIWDKIPVPLYTYESDGLTIKSREMDWDFTGSPADAMYMVKQAIKNETGEDWTIQLSESLPATITISSQSNSIFSLLTSIANECKTEWWADKSTNVLYLSQCKKGTELTLKVGDNVGVPTVTQSKDGYYTRFYVFGSTRNITQDYQGGQATNHIVNKRLTLDPIKYPGGYKDTKGHFDNGVFVSDLQKGEVFIKTLYFDDVYPKSKLTISDVRARLKYRLDTNGNKVRIGGTDEEPVYEQYAIWYFQISGLNFDPSTIIEEKELAVSFESGQLAGRDFKLTYHEKASVVNDSADFTPFNVKAGDFKINIDESTGNIIPGMAYIIPQNGDDVILYNIEMPDEYVASAQEELELELDKEMESYTCDNNSYEFDSYPVSFYDDGTDLNIGQSVAYVNGDKILHTRVIMVEKRLDFSFQQRIRIGNEIIKGNTQQLKEEVANVNQNIDIIKAFNELSTSLSNAYANAQREMIEGFAAIKNIWEFDNDESHWSTDNNGDKRKTIKSKYNVWSSGYISALGTNTSEDSSGTGSFDLLQDWDKYVDSTAKSMALSAFLGKDLLDRITSLEKGQKGHKITISGSGNVVVNVEESSDGGTLTFTKGNIDLSGYATKTELEAVSKKTDSVTQRVDEFLGGSDTDGIINKWKELEAFLDGQQQGTTLSSLLDKKVDKTIQVKAGEGLSGGGALSGNVTLSLATVGTAGTYTKVTVDKYGRVTGHATLSASDIPTLEISKINGLQEELDKKLNISDFGNKFATEMAKWFKKDTEGNVFVANSKGFYSESFVSAMGKSSGGSSSGGGSYDRLDNWADYSADRATWVLSAKLGYDLNTRVSSLESGSAINFETSGTGNALTGFSKSGNTVTFTKGTFLTEHQKLYTLTMQRNGEGVGSYVPTADKIININACTAINVPQGFTAGALSSVGVIALSFASGYSLPTTAKQQQWDTAYSFVESIAGSDANGVIDKWNEIISFLDGIGDSSTLEGLLNDINSNVTAVSSRVTKLEGYFVNGVAKEAAKTTGTLSINGKNFNGSASVNVGVIGVSYGGTGKSSVASGSMLYASAANTYAELATTEFGRNLLKANSGSVVSGLYAEAAYKLQNKRTIWGQAFDGTANISGAMYNVSAIVNETSNPYNHRLELGRTGVNQWDFYEYGGVFNFYRCQDSNGENKVILFKINNGSVGILTDTPTHTLHVNGTGYFSNTLSVASQIRIGNGTITWDSTKGCFHFSHGLYSDSFISAMGLNDSGSGGGSASYERLDNWTDYAEEKATWVLSAKLGNELNERLKSVEAGGATSVVTTGTGNVITAISKNGNTITATKGITALTSHQAIYSLTLQGNGTTIGTFNPKSANATINITAANIGAAAASHTHTLSALSDLKAGWSTLLKEDPKAYVTRWPAFSEVTSKPTTLAGYGITDAYTKTDADSRYVNVSGDTMTGSLNFANNIWNNVGDDAAIGDHNVAGHIGIKALNSANPGISFYNNSTTNVGKLTVNGTTLQWNTSTIWHAGNDGSGSGLDADLLDGFDSTYFVNFLGLSTQNWDSHYKGYILHFNSVEREGDNPYDLIGGNQATIIQVLPDNTVQYGAQLAIGFGSKKLAYRSRKVNSDGSYGWNSWDLISAGTLATPRTLWGQSFDGSANVSGDIHVSGNIYDTQIVQSVSGKYLDLKGSGLGFYTQNTIKAVIQPNGNFGIGTTAPSAKLHIVGDLFINTGDPTLKIYSGMINDTKSDGNICLQTNIDTRDGETQEYPTQYPQRCNLVLQPRGGQVYVGMNPDGGDLRYKLLVNGKIKSVDEVVSTSAFRIAKGNYGVLMRNDGTSYYMLLTNSGQAEVGTWNSLRPFIVDLATGNVDLVQAGEHLSVSGDTQFNKSVSIGNGKIEWDEANKAFKFTGGIYSDSYISAMGLNAAGGSGGSYERLDSWSDYTEDKATWVLSALLGSNLNTRVSALEAGGATSVVTSGTGNVVTAITKSGNVITATKGITALTSHQNIYALTLQGNGSTIGTFNPKTGNSTINITAANIGAAASSHTHNYLPLTGGTITGELYFNPTDASDPAPKIYSSAAEKITSLNFAVGDDTNDRFVFRINFWDNTNDEDRERFIINWDGVTSKAAITAPSFNGNLNGNASTASKLGTSTVGGTAKPIYLNAGTATALSATVGSSSLPVYLNAGTITQCGTSLGVSITGNSATTNQLNVSVLTSQSLAAYNTSGHLYYAGGGNTVSDKPSGVDAFGMFTMQTASGWQGQILMASNTATSLYWRTANKNFNGGWRKILDSSNYGEYAYSKTDADGRFVNLSGDTMTGALKVPELRFTNGTAIWFDQYGNVTFGSTSSSNWWYIGSSSNSPSIAVNFGTGNVGIGQSASTTYKLAVNGDVHANSFTGSLNGNASTASKWQAARTVTMNGFADCSFSIDGSANVSFDHKPYNFHLYVDNKNNYPWHRIAKIGPITAFYQDKEVTLLLSQGYDGGKWGIVRITLRTNSTGTVSTAHVEWLNRRAFSRTDVKIGLYNASGETYADVFLKANGSYSSVTGLVLTQGGRGTLGRTWTLVNSSEVGNTTTTDKLTSTECWTSIEVAAEELHKKAYTNIIEADDAGGVGILYDHGKLTAISGTTMPNEGLRLYRVYNNGYPAAYGNLMSVRGENSGAGELLLEWKGSTELGHIYYRSKRDNTSSGWSSWGTLAFLTDNVASATKLQTARSINGTSFDGTANITTAKWGSYRTVCIQDNARENTGAKLSVDGSTDITLLMPSTANFSQLTISSKLISNGQTDFNKQWLKNVGGIWFGSADSSSVFASFDGDGTQTGLQSKVGTSIYFGWRGGTRAMTIDSAGNVVIGNTSTVNSAYKLDVKGDVRTQGDIVPYSNGQYNIGSSGARWNTLFTQSIELYGFTPYIDFHFNNSSADYTSRIVEVVSGCLAINGTLAVLKSGNVGIGTTLPTEKLYVSGNIAATGAVTALVLSSSSDIRLKDIRKNVCLSVEEIAKAPAVEFAWKKTGDLAVGSIAQYWQPILPQAIHKRDNYLSMQYDVIALLASIANARRILSIEKKIKELEEEVKRLKIS